MSKVRVLLLSLVVAGLAALAIYLYGRNACPPPDWWLWVFVPSGNFGCVQ